MGAGTERERDKSSEIGAYIACWPSIGDQLRRGFPPPHPRGQTGSRAPESLLGGNRRPMVARRCLPVGMSFGETSNSASGNEKKKRKKKRSRRRGENHLHSRRDVRLKFLLARVRVHIGTSENTYTARRVLRGF